MALPIKATILFLSKASTLQEHGTDYNIYHVKQYPTYRYYSSKPEDYDIALVQTKSRIEFNKFVQPACLWRSEDTTSLTHVSVSGWGTTNPSNTITIYFKITLFNFRMPYPF